MLLMNIQCLFCKRIMIDYGCNNLIYLKSKDNECLLLTCGHGMKDYIIRRYKLKNFK